jgi:hypothetical protein
MRRVNLVIVRIVLFLYLTSSYLSATHIHHKAVEQHGKCKVCIIIKNLHSKDILDSNPLCLNCNNYYELIQFIQQQFSKISLKGFYANTPPNLF